MNKYILLGLKYGYPKCCISEFIYCIESRVIHLRKTRKLSGTGYIPCSKCNSKYTVNELINNIDSKREITLDSFRSVYLAKEESNAAYRRSLQSYSA